MITLRPHQQRILDRMLDYDKGQVIVPTGGGKTLTMIVDTQRRHDGVNNGTRLATPPQDDRHIPNRWSELAKKHDLDLVLCVAAAQRRGMVDEGEMERNKKMQTISLINLEFQVSVSS